MDILQAKGDGLICPMAVFVRDGRVLTGLRHYTKDTWKDISVWTLPGGRSEKDETIEQTLRREVQEEVNISDFEIRDLIGTAPGAKEGDTVAMFYCTTEQEAKLMEPEKFSEWVWVPIADYLGDKKYSGFNPPAREKITHFLMKLG